MLKVNVLALIINKNQFLKYGFEYIERNQEKIAFNLATFLDLVKLNIEQLLNEKILINNNSAPPQLI